jgi:hypothetical protein
MRKLSSAVKVQTYCALKLSLECVNNDTLVDTQMFLPMLVSLYLIIKVHGKVSVAGRSSSAKQFV